MIPVLHLVTDDEILHRGDFASTAEEVLEAGGPGLALHLRGPRTSAATLYDLADRIRPVASANGSLLLANDRVDLVLALDLPGAQLGQRSLPPVVARRLLGDRRIVGLSIHGMEEAGEEGGEMVDFFLLGTIFSTASHPGLRPGKEALVRRIRQETGKPLVAIGGITPDRVQSVLGAGAHGVAVRGGVWDAGDPSTAVRGYLEVLRHGRVK